MTDLVALAPEAYAAEALGDHPGLIAVLAEPGERPETGAARVNRMARGAVARVVASEAFGKLKPGEAMRIDWPAGLAAEAVLVLRLGRKAEARDAWQSPKPFPP